MKLRNRKTGEIRDIKNILVDEMFSVNSLAELNEEWEDYEEPKMHWYIESYGEVVGEIMSPADNEILDGKRQIDNYFETEAEAEKALEKLKAWKRLKDKGFRFTGIAGVSNYIYVSFETNSKYVGGHIMYDEYSNTDNNLREYNEDLTLLFGGQE